LDSENLADLFGRYLDNRCSQGEIEILMLHFHTTNAALLEKLVDQALGHDIPLLKNNSREIGSITRVHQKLGTVISEDISLLRLKSARIRKMRWRAAAAASIVLIASLCGYLFLGPPLDRFTQNRGIENDIAPGINGAILTLDDGHKINLTGHLAGELAEQSGISITKKSSGLIVYERKETPVTSTGYNTLQTGNGQQAQVLLPDGTKVYLNSASSIRYPASFGALKERKVILQGEAYFEVYKDRSRPFIVKTAGQQVEVLGTHFNINSYPDEPFTKTFLQEGSVKISLTGSSGFAVLRPGELAIQASGGVKVLQANAELELAWKLGFFSFNKTPLETVMRQISRWYDVEVVYDRPELKSRLIGGTVSRYDKVSGLLEAIEKTRAVKFSLEGKKITVY
jgi:transmembrane sensor